MSENLAATITAIRFEVWDVDAHAFGFHIRTLRKARGLTQEVLAERARLSADTIRRLEAGSFSPSMKTLVSLARGLHLRLSSIMLSFELGELPIERELLEILAGRSEAEARVGLEVLRAVFEHGLAGSRAPPASASASSD
ncbi:DNA-binding protein [Plesiocystis pacifica SIR-1]|uniref:DNA-binding protein n=1 Tax=Plesiocystis pacifica SIR-1 TaxID=391625 RepID=A6GFR3_9BACT|nr:helix-turn-helix transcriptional regulator [Plesiocystis pacifica]EDM75314.1 DNA-binding protein [Plesiocystis pacifica SIR-1]